MERLELAALKRVLICDGGMGTQLQQRGLVPGTCPELWCIEQPDQVKAIHQAYREAGSDIVETNTFGGSNYKLKHYGLEARAFEINRAGAAIAREVAGDTQYVLASMGPTGAFMEPYGEETDEQFYEAFKEQALAFQEGGADAAIAETMMAIEECCVAIKAIRENTRLTAVASFTFDPQPDGSYASMMGVRPAEFAQAAIAAGAQVIGANCGLGPAHMLEIIKELRTAAPMSVPILAMPNAGMPVVENGETHFKETPEEMAGAAKLLIAHGAQILGGCCGTTPAHIRAIAQAVK